MFNGVEFVWKISQEIYSNKKGQDSHPDLLFTCTPDRNRTDTAAMATGF